MRHITGSRTERATQNGVGIRETSKRPRTTALGVSRLKLVRDDCVKGLCFSDDMNALKRAYEIKRLTDVPALVAYNIIVIAGDVVSLDFDISV